MVDPWTADWLDIGGQYRTVRYGTMQKRWKDKPTQCLPILPIIPVARVHQEQAFGWCK